MLESGLEVIGLM